MENRGTSLGVATEGALNPRRERSVCGYGGCSSCTRVPATTQASQGLDANELYFADIFVSGDERRVRFVERFVVLVLREVNLREEPMTLGVVRIDEGRHLANTEGFVPLLRLNQDR